MELWVERIGAQGDGIAQYRERPVFLPFTVPGDHVRGRLGARRGGGYEARVVETLAVGSGRSDPRCRHFGSCGGCALQHLNPEAYRKVKLANLHAALEKVGIDRGLVGPLRIVPPARRRARLGLQRARDPILPTQLGYRERFRHNLVDVCECPVLEPVLFAIVGELRRFAGEVVPPGANADITLTRTDSGVDLLIEAPYRPGLQTLEALARFAAERDLPRIFWRSPGYETPVIEQRPVRVVLSGTAVPYPPGAFLQASAAAEAILVEEVLAGIGSGHPVLDLFAGLGTFTFALARDAAVHAVEGEERSAAALAAAASEHPQVSVERRDLAKHPLPPETLAHYAAAVFDPPRAGAARQAEALAASAIERVVAVSCNTATFARDAAKLVAGGYRLERVTPVDQFVWTPHLELVAVFQR